MRKISFCAAGVAVLILIGVGTSIGLGIGTSTPAAASTSCPGLPYCDPNTGIIYPGGRTGRSGRLIATIYFDDKAGVRFFNGPGWRKMAGN